MDRRLPTNPSVKYAATGKLEVTLQQHMIFRVKEVVIDRRNPEML